MSIYDEAMEKIRNLSFKELQELLHPQPKFVVCYLFGAKPLYTFDTLGQASKFIEESFPEYKRSDLYLGDKEHPDWILYKAPHRGIGVIIEVPRPPE